MKKITLPALLLTLTTLSSCQVIGDIFKAGFYVGIAAVLIIVILIIYIIFKFRGGSNS